jgi:hypothetical protein
MEVYKTAAVTLVKQIMRTYLTAYYCIMIVFKHDVFGDFNDFYVFAAERSVC